jgi:hypothetical protein
VKTAHGKLYEACALKAFMSCASTTSDTIGDTPVVKLSALAPRDVSIYVKVEAFVGASVGGPTVPQAFIGGDTEMFDAAKSGALQAKLRATAGVAFDADAKVDYGERGKLRSLAFRTTPGTSTAVITPTSTPGSCSSSPRVRTGCRR